jgi:parallel beta-helix repeat protein
MGFRVGVVCMSVGLCLTAGTAHAQTVSVPGNYPTIQAAINAVVNGNVPNGTVIEVQPGTYNEALLVNATPKSLTVRGVNGPVATVVNALGTGVSALRILNATGAVRFEGLTLRGGTGVQGTGGGFTISDASPALVNVIFESNTAFDSGGGVIIRSNALFSDCIIRNNTAQRFGGGMVITTGSRPTFSNCQIRDNIAGAGPAGVANIGSGGGVHVNDASPTFHGCLITGNQSKFAAGGIFHIGAFGSPNGPAVLVLEDTEVSNNVSSRFSAADNPAEGGGIHVEDNAIGYLIRTKVLNNTANTSGGLSAYRARFEVQSSIIEGNHAQDPQGIGGFGGGIGISSNNVSTPLRQAGSLVITDSVVRGNDARAGAGIFVSGDQTCGSPTPSCNPASALRASAQITDSLLDSNGAGLSGGGIRADRTDLTIGNSHILKNNVAASGQSYGGGILLALGSQSTISNSTIAGNNAVNFGGGVFLDDSAVLNVSQSRIYRNVAGSGGGLYVGNNGPPAGTIQSSTIADNSTYQIHEQACSPLQRTILNYQNNVITPRSGQSDLYFSTCGGATSTIGAFNALPSGRASGNTSSAPSFASFMATPDVGPSYLSWAVSRASSVTISGGVGTINADTGSTTVSPSALTTYSLTSSGGPGGAVTASVIAPRFWGGSSDTPLSADFDADGRTDLAVYRGSTGQWLVARSTAGFLQQGWGAPSLGDTPVPADFDGDGKADIAVYRKASGQWIILNSATGTVSVVQWGAPSLDDVPVPADYDGDNRADIAVYRRTTGDWFIRLSTGGSWQARWGAPSLGDVPVPQDYDGDARTDLAVYRSANGQWFILQSTGGSTAIGWGAPSLRDTPVPADYDGDGKADVAIARAQTGEWFIRRSTGGTIVGMWGLGDARVPADYGGVGRAQIAIWQSASGTWLIKP